MDHDSHPFTKHTERYQLVSVGDRSNEQGNAHSEDETGEASAAVDQDVYPQEWVPKLLQTSGILPTAVATLVLMAAIIALAEVSRRQRGIASIGIQSDSLMLHFGLFSVGISFLWTTLPVLIFSVYGLVVSAIVSQAAARQPYVELREYEEDEWGAPAETSVLLDYASYWAVTAPWKALKNRHYLLFYSFCMVLIVNIVLSALSAHILYATLIPFERSVQIQRTHELDGSGFTGRDSLVPTMDIVAGTYVYDGENIQWTTNNASILPFSIPQSLAGKAAWNLTTTAIAHTARMSCRVLGDSDFELREGDDKEWYFSWRDRGCSSNGTLFNGKLDIFYVDYVHTYWHDCDLPAYYGRVVVVAAQNLKSKESTLTNKVGISCVPSYYNVTGTLNITSEASSPMGFSIQSFTPTNFVRMDPYPSFGYPFGLQLQQSTIYDPSLTLSATNFGSLIYYASKKGSVSAPLSAESLLNATASVYISAFTVMSQKFLVKQSSSSSFVDGSVYTEESRVAVVQSVAYAVVAILVLLIIMLGWIYWYTKNHRSILYEEPVALVGAAAILRRSELMRWIERIDADAWEGKVSRAFVYEQKDLSPRKGWRMDRWARPSKMSVISTVRNRSELRV